MSKGKVRGLMEFFLSGFPNKDYAWALFNQGIPESKRADATLSWDVITRDYLRVIKEALDHMEKQEDMAYRYSKSGNKLVFEAPDGVDEREKRRSDYDRREHHRETEALQGMDWEDPDGVSVGDNERYDDPNWDWDQEDQGQEYGYETAQEAEYEDHHRRTSVNHQYQDQDQDTDEDPEADSEHVPDVPANQQYLTAIVGKDGQTLVCYDFAKLGKCKYQDKPGGCKYSHAPEDARRLKAAELLGPANFVPRTPRYTGGTRSLQQVSGHLSDILLPVGIRGLKGVVVDGLGLVRRLQPRD
jgi:hypothetical protein